MDKDRIAGLQSVGQPINVGVPKSVSGVAGRAGDDVGLRSADVDRVRGDVGRQQVGLGQSGVPPNFEDEVVGVARPTIDVQGPGGHDPGVGDEETSGFGRPRCLGVDLTGEGMPVVKGLPVFVETGRLTRGGGVSVTG